MVRKASGSLARAPLVTDTASHRGLGPPGAPGWDSPEPEVGDKRLVARRGQAGVWQGTPCRVKSVLMGDIGGGQQLKSCRGPVGAGRGRSGNGLGPCGLPWSQAGGGGTRDSALCFGAPPLRWKQSPEATVLVTAGPTQPQMALSDSHAPSPQSQDPGQIPPFARGKAKQDLGWNDNLRSHIVEY